MALCVYITDHGRLRDLRPHAHWILNHARIHHPSFGKRTAPPPAPADEDDAEEVDEDTALAYYRHSPELLLTNPDWRLTSPYGAGVSRPVRYLEGKESEKEKNLF